MKNQLKGLGVFTLVISLVLFMLGTLEATQALPVTSVTQHLSAEPESEPLEFGTKDGIQFKDALERQFTESVELHQVLRKLPLLASLFLSINVLDEKVSRAHLSVAYLHFSLSKDLPVAFRNLRI